MATDDGSLGSDICCPECGEISDSYEAYVESGAHANEGCTRCPYCRAFIPDDQWITD